MDIPDQVRQRLHSVAEHHVVGVRPWLFGHPVGQPRLLRMFLPCRFGYPRRPTRGTALRLVVPLGPAFFLGTSPPVVVGDHYRPAPRLGDVRNVPSAETDPHLRVAVSVQPLEGSPYRQGRGISLAVVALSPLADLVDRLRRFTAWKELLAPVASIFISKIDPLKTFLAPNSWRLVKPRFQ